MRNLFAAVWTISILTFTTLLNATIINVPDDFPTIQEAINNSVNGDTILVATGTYYENIKFNGKNILLSSYYIFNNDVSYISNTIINGSQPQHPDTASCVLIINGEDSTAILQGFTLREGTGTKWIDEHGAGTYVEGGGILITQSSPTIKNNLIIENEAIRTGLGITSAGGGGIRVGDGNPHIINNVIMSNSAMYGGGIVLNYTGAIIRNNIFYNNSVYQASTGPTFGGGGIWAYNNLGSTPKIIENNTILYNSSSGSGSSASGRGGGILVWSTSVQASNNIIYGNTQLNGEQISLLSSASSVFEYSLVEGGWTGTGNIDVNPYFENSSFYLSDSSACIDAGNPDTANNDPEGNPGMALWPAKGTIRNDIGAYGGPFSKELNEFLISSVGDKQVTYYPGEFRLEQNYPNPFNPTTKIKFTVPSVGTSLMKFVQLKVYDVLGNEVATLLNEEKPAGDYEVEFSVGQDSSPDIASGIYFYQLRLSALQSIDGKADEIIQARKMILLK